MRRFAWLLAGAFLLTAPAAAHAAFPGENGRVVFVGVDDAATDLYSSEPDNNDAALQLTHDGISANPAYSPDGSRLAFTSGTAVYIGDQYANDPQFVLDPGVAASGIDWSPDGTKLVASFPNCVMPGCAPDIYVFGTDGTGLTNLTTTTYGEYNPSWWGTGTKIAFDSLGTGGGSDIYSMNADGTGVANLTTGFSANAYEPDWIPPNLGSRIVFGSGSSSYQMFGDGTGITLMPNTGRQPAWSPDATRVASQSGAGGVFTTGPHPSFHAEMGHGVDPDWQVRQPTPVPPRGLEPPRPKGATPLLVPLVINYNQCASSNATTEHGPPLAYPSCPPARTGQTVTVGTPDANGFPSIATGSVRFDSILGNPATPADEADVRIRVQQTDLRRNIAGFPDYTGALILFAPLRVIDLWNNGGPEGAGTMIDFPLRLVVDCVETSGPEGGTCSVDTTVDAVMPGLARERKRTIWQLGQVLVHFAGGDEDPYSLGDNRPLLAQGVFVP